MRRIAGRMLRLLRITAAGVAKVQTDLRGLPADQQELRRSLTARAERGESSPRLIDAISDEEY
jgi:hypothetical protein